MPNDTDVQRTLGRLESKVDSLLVALSEDRASVKSELSEHDNRLTVLETWKSRTSGIVVGGVAVVGTLFTLIFRVLSIL